MQMLKHSNNNAQEENPVSLQREVSVIGYQVYKCDECTRGLILADGGSFWDTEKTKHNSRGYGKSKVVVVIADRERKNKNSEMFHKRRERNG